MSYIIYVWFIYVLDGYNANAVSNRSTIVQKGLVQSHDRYVRLTRDVVVEFNLVENDTLAVQARIRIFRPVT